MDTVTHLATLLAPLIAVALGVEHFWAKLIAVGRGAGRVAATVCRGGWALWAATDPGLRAMIVAAVLTSGARVVVVLHFRSYWPPATAGDVVGSIGGPVLVVAWPLATWPLLTWVLELPVAAQALIAVPFTLSAAMFAVAVRAFEFGRPADWDLSRAFADVIGAGAVATVLLCALFATVVLVAGFLPARRSETGPESVQLELPLISP